MPDVPHRHLAGVRLGVGGEVGKALDLAFALDREVAGIVDHVAQQIVRVPVVAGLALDRDRHDVGRVDEADRVAVRLGRRERPEAGVTARTGAVLHDDAGVPAQLRLQEGGEKAGGLIGGAAGRIGDDHRDRPLRVLRGGRPCQQQDACCCQAGPWQ